MTHPLGNARSCKECGGDHWTFLCEEGVFIDRCPRCKEKFRPFLRFQVGRCGWFGLRKKTLALICWACKNIVGWE